MNNKISQPSSHANSKMVAKNTILLYARMFLTMAVGLFTSRVVLNSLGVDDYGLYNVVGGIVVILGFLNSAMTGATQRFLNFELGRRDTDVIKRVFSSAIAIHIIVAAAILIILETVGLWYLNTYVKVDPARLTAANWVFQFSILSFLFSIVTVPYNATIIAHEKMSAFAYISIFEVVLKLIVAYAIYTSKYDRLIIYGFLILVAQVTTRFIYVIYSNKHFEESTFSKNYLDKNMMRNMLSFSSWTIVGNLSYIGHTQGIALLINFFFGVAVNAAQGISNQINGIVNQFVSNFLMALKPQVVKTYAAKEFSSMYSLIIRGSQLSIYLVAMFVIPLTLEAPTLLKAWLGIVPDYTVIFVRITLLISLADSISGLFASAKGATGNIRNYQIVLTLIGLLHLPIVAIFYIQGFPPQYAMFVYLFLILVLQVVRVSWVCNSIDLPKILFIKEVVVRSILVIMLASILPVAIHFLLPQTIWSSLMICALSFVTLITLALILGFNSHDRDAILSMVKAKIPKKIIKH